MPKDINSFIIETKKWLFALEAELSLGSASAIKEEISSYMKRVSDLFVEAEKEYSYDLNPILDEFPRISDAYRKAVAS